MEIEYLKQLMQLFDQSTATELSIEEEGTKVHLSRQPAQQTVQMVATAPAPVHIPQNVHLNQAAQIAHTPNAEVIPPAPAANLHIIHSPIVGTFYRASAPEAPPFVKVGDKVSVGSPLCIVEAMKLMNEIESDVSGTVVRCLVDNAKPVEYNQPLFEIQLG
jgi:acetyl-CoA carboxylase biotin carboxyl carrier protein